MPPAVSNRLFEVLDVYWRSPESGGLWYKSRRLKKTICSLSEGEEGHAWCRGGEPLREEDRGGDV